MAAEHIVSNAIPRDRDRTPRRALPQAGSGDERAFRWCDTDREKGSDSLFWIIFLFLWVAPERTQNTLCITAISLSICVYAENSRAIAACGERQNSRRGSRTR